MAEQRRISHLSVKAGAAVRSGNAVAPAALSPMADDVAAGLLNPNKRLPHYLFYDRAGSELFERITVLPEYYLTRAEREIFEEHAPVLASLISGEASLPLHVVELGAGTAEKSEIILRELVRQRNSAVAFLPVDVSEAALRVAVSRLSRNLSSLDVQPLVMQHERAFGALQRLGPRRAVLFIGSSIGNYDDAAALELLRGVRRALAPGDGLLLSTDLRKNPAALLAAYDDAQGVTAAFNKNVLARINRELGGHFELTRFAHVAVWNEEHSRIEMHLESTVEQRVRIDALGVSLTFRAGERIHTESSVKYDAARVDALLSGAGFRRAQSFQDAGARFSVHWAEAQSNA